MLCFSITNLQAQSKKKRAKMQLIALQKSNAQLVANLTKHVQYLASDSLEGRRTGTKGEELALQYIIQQYIDAGIEPKGINGYIQPFEINEGKHFTSNTSLNVHGKTLVFSDDFFPFGL